jgi:hypothetical protein
VKFVAQVDKPRFRREEFDGFLFRSEDVVFDALKIAPVVARRPFVIMNRGLLLLPCAAWWHFPA